MLSLNMIMHIIIKINIKSNKSSHIIGIHRTRTHVLSHNQSTLNKSIFNAIKAPTARIY